LGREDATGRGGYYAIRHLEDELKLKPGKSRVVVQGFGNVAYWFAQLMHNDGYRIVGLSDSKSAIYDAAGLDPVAVLEHKKKAKTLEGAPSLGKLEVMTNEALLEKDCDLLVPAALENQITGENASRIAAPVILELANGPTTPEADEKLNAAGKTVIPDILANSGGVTVSYFEWVQNKAGYYWGLEEVYRRLKEIIEPEARRVYDLARKDGLDMRTAAYVHGLDRIAKAIEAHGTQAYFRENG
jgi:glutamate dehydrogenase (NADP+)